MNYYFVGIKGSGMAALACILKDLGNNVSGADINEYFFTEKELRTRNIKIDSLNDMHYKDNDIIIIGNSFLDNYNFKGNKVITYQEALANIVDKFYSIAVCGTHGKTTTTNMIRFILEKYYPVSYLIGDGTGKGNINSKFFVFEACEHRRHFLSYHPNLIVCTNIDYDHVDYYKNINDYKNAFYDFFKQVKDGVIKNEFTISNCVYSQNGIYFDIKDENNITYSNLFLPFYGKHMLDNSLLAISLAKKLNINVMDSIKILQNYPQAKRRFQIQELDSNIIVDDYGHHPKEILATITALKQKYIDKKIVLIYHPDRPKRLLTFKNDFLKVFSLADKAYIIPFINQDIEKKEALENIISTNKISLINQDLFNKKYSNTIFLFTGSKNMQNLINKLKNNYTN